MLTRIRQAVSLAIKELERIWWVLKIRTMKMTMHLEVAGVDFIALNHSINRHSHQEDSKYHPGR